MDNETKALTRLRETLGSVQSPMMNGDNLAILLCGYFENPDQDVEDDTGWTPDAIAGYEEVCAAIHAHYAATIEAQAAEIDRLTLNGIHTCSDRCMRPACMARRERDEVRAALAKAVELLRDEKHGLTDEWCARCASFLAQHKDTSHDA